MSPIYKGYDIDLYSVQEIDRALSLGRIPRPKIITKLGYEKFSIVQNMLAALAEDILRLIDEVDAVYGYSHLRFGGIEDGTVNFHGFETWSYGGYEDFYFDFPLILLFDNSELDSYLRNRRHNKLQKEKERLEKKAREEDSKLYLIPKADYELLQTLKRKD